MASDKPTLISIDTAQPTGTVSIAGIAIAVANDYIASNIFTVANAATMANATSTVNVNISSSSK